MDEMEGARSIKSRSIEFLQIRETLAKLLDRYCRFSNLQSAMPNIFTTHQIVFSGWDILLECVSDHSSVVCNPCFKRRIVHEPNSMQMGKILCSALEQEHKNTTKECFGFALKSAHG